MTQDINLELTKVDAEFEKLACKKWLIDWLIDAWLDHLQTVFEQIDFTNLTFDYRLI